MERTSEVKRSESSGARGPLNLTQALVKQLADQERNSSRFSNPYIVEETQAEAEAAIEETTADQRTASTAASLATSPETAEPEEDPDPDQESKIPAHLTNFYSRRGRRDDYRRRDDSRDRRRRDDSRDNRRRDDSRDRRRRRSSSYRKVSPFRIIQIQRSNERRSPSSRSRGGSPACKPYYPYNL